MHGFLNSVRHALRGLEHTWKEERNFRIQTTCAAVVLVLAFLLQLDFLESAIVVLGITLVLAGEIFNTLLENMLDIIHPDHHAGVGKMKDMMAGVVLVLSVGATALGVLVFAHHLLTTV